MRHSEIIVICEDQAHSTFIHRFLKLRGVNRSRVRILPLPAGSGSGAKRVLDQVATELKALRTRSKAMIVMLDADNHTLEERKRQLDATCIKAKVRVRQPDEAALYLIPTRNIETWFRYLTNKTWDEAENYPHDKRHHLAKQAANRLHDMCFKAQKLREPAPSSLQDACEEWARMQS